MGSFSVAVRVGRVPHRRRRRRRRASVSSRAAARRRTVRSVGRVAAGRSAPRSAPLSRWTRPRPRAPPARAPAAFSMWPVWSSKKKSGSNSRRNSPLGRPPRNMASSTSMLPVHQRADRALVRRRAARGDQRGAHAHAARRLALQPVQRLEQRLERARRQRRAGAVALVALEGVQPVALEHALGLVGEQHRVAVEGDAHLVRVGVAGARAVRVHARRRHAGVQRRAHVGFVGADRNRFAASGRR